ncbi:hypothetical protein [uncultured Oscillibacter sp.]|uniref:hypothetical protein n=1 Tax=uncultured Oscillibacter sp. TaxID=876091 RepID=UPI0025F16DED|nr:hypothetical protein [uncultured Oscillibacter sp.]
MMTKISGLRTQGAASPTGSPRGAGRSQAAALPRRDTDRYVPGSGEAGETVRRLTEEMVRSLAGRYDVRHMTRDEYGSLLRDLRGLGAINAKDFGVGSGGEVPYTPPDGVEMTMGPADRLGLGAWPSGRERADLLELLRSGAGYCAEFASRQAEGSGEGALAVSLAASWRRLAGIFEQIDGYRS